MPTAGLQPDDTPEHGPSWASSLVSTASAILSGSAAGGLWALASIFSQHPLAWLALPVAWSLAVISRHWPLPRGLPADVLVLLAGLCAVTARLGLLAAVVIGANVGSGLFETLAKAGPGMLWFVARLRLDPLVALYYAASLLCGLVLARRRPRGPAARALPPLTSTAVPAPRWKS